jgi:hypothetical protein
MPDNVSLTVSEINSLKQTGNTLLSRLKTQPYVFSNDSTGKSVTKLSLISDGANAGIKIYAGSDTVKMTKNTGNTIIFTIPSTAKGNAANPCITVGIASSKDISIYRLSNNVVYDHSTGKITVYISAAPDKKHAITSKSTLEVRVNVLAINYA